MRKAASYRPSLELRNEAIACLALPDVRVERQIVADTPWAAGALAFDWSLDRYASVSSNGVICIRRSQTTGNFFASLVRIIQSGSTYLSAPTASFFTKGAPVTKPTRF